MSFLEDDVDGAIQRIVIDRHKIGEHKVTELFIAVQILAILPEWSATLP